MAVSYQSAYKLIRKVVTSMPIDVWDEDTGEVWEACTWNSLTLARRATALGHEKLVPLT